MFGITSRKLWNHSVTKFLKYSTRTLNQSPNDETLKMAVVDPKILKPFINPIIAEEDYFKINNLVTIEDMFEARVHYGHKIGTLQDNMKWALFGERLDVCIFDLEITQRYLTRALNFLACMAYQGAIIMSQILHVESLSEKLGQYAHTRKWEGGTLTNSRHYFNAPIRLPDVVIFFNTLTSVLEPHPAIIECAKLTIPTIAIVDSNSQPNYITYPVPGNDDSMTSFTYYSKMFKTAIERGTAARKEHENMQNKNIQKKEKISVI